MARNTLIAITLLLAAGAAQADAGQAYEAAGAGIPAALSAFIWAPLLGFCFVCVAALLWMIRADTRGSARRDYRDARAALTTPRKSLPTT